MAAPDTALIAAADEAGLPLIYSEDHPVVAIQASRAGLGRRQWTRVPGPVTGKGIEHWFQDDAGDIAYSCEHAGKARLIIFDADGRPIADVRHGVRRAA